MARYQPIDLHFKPIKPVHYPIDVGVDFLLSNVLFGNLFTSSVEKDLHAFDFVERILHDEPNCTDCNGKYDIPDLTFHLALPFAQRFIDTAIWIVSCLGRSEFGFHP